MFVNKIKIQNLEKDEYKSKKYGFTTHGSIIKNFGKYFKKKITKKINNIKKPSFVGEDEKSARVGEANKAIINHLALESSL